MVAGKMMLEGFLPAHCGNPGNRKAAEVNMIMGHMLDAWYRSSEVDFL